MLCKCGQPAEPRSIRCTACNDAKALEHREYQREYMRKKRLEEQGRTGHAGDRENLQRLARELGLVR